MVAHLEALGMLLCQMGSVSGTSHHPAALRSGGEPLHSPYPCRRQDGNGPWGHWGWGWLPKGGGGSISIIEEKQECFSPFCYFPCCRWGPEVVLGFSCCRLLRQAGAPGLPPDLAGSSKRETSKQRKKPTFYHSNINFRLHCCPKQA